MVVMEAEGTRGAEKAEGLHPEATGCVGVDCLVGGFRCE